jgi:hypothetical protein
MGICIKYELRTEAHVQNVVDYLGDKKHPSHLEYEISDALCYGVLTAEDFSSATVAAVAEVNARRRRGRPIENLAALFIDRFADGTALTPEEEELHERAVLASIAAGTSAVVYRHRNTETLSIDFNFLVPNIMFDVFPLRTRRTSRKDPLADMKKASNVSVERLNELRRERGTKMIVRVSDRKKALARARRGKLLEEELRERGGVTSANIRDVLESLGHQVTRFDLARNTISIITRGSAEASRFKLDELLDAAQGLELPDDDVESTDQFAKFNTPRDRKLRKLAGQQPDEPPPVG